MDSYYLEFFYAYLYIYNKDFKMYFKYHIALNGKV
jgi:hypothetical protein